MNYPTEEQRAAFRKKQDEERTAYKRRFVELVPLIAAELGATVDATFPNDSYRSVAFTDCEGVERYRLGLSVDEWKGRLSVSADTRRGLTYSDHYRDRPGSITMALLVTAAPKVATAHCVKQIQRRLLDAARTYYAAVEEKVTAQDAAQKRCEQLAGQMEAAGHGLFKARGNPDDWRRNHSVTLHAYPGEESPWSGYGDAKVTIYKGGTVDLDLKSVPPELARNLLHALAVYCGLSS